MSDSQDFPSNREDLLSLEAVRSQARRVLDAARRGELTNFDYNESRMPIAAEYVTSVISRDYGPDRYDHIPPHGRLQHFSAGGVDRLNPMIEGWRYDRADEVEITRRVVDLLFFSVLIDAGAGDVWQFRDHESNKVYVRSEGIAIASWHMFLAGTLRLSGGPQHSIDAQGLISVDEATMSQYFQVTPENPMKGFKSRIILLHQLGASLHKLPNVFGQNGRPGNIVDYLQYTAKEQGVIDFAHLWNILQDLLLPIWPKERTHVDGQTVGDAWPLQLFARQAKGPNGSQNIASMIQPFHKLTQWLACSLRVPFTKFLGVKWLREDLSTGLAEYRHGGVFVDLGVLSLKRNTLQQGQENSGHDVAEFDMGSDVIVEWRAMTVALIDELHGMVVSRLAKPLTLSQLLEAGSFKAGRELAAEHRPKTRSGPILISGDGTLL